ncbi:YqaA family protein [Zavarzinia compransoris]|uniref:Cytochrome B n=1 Tax=Zavarzinia compransoris TaxID=1264899 RepID=A0A317E7P1_9PROT|nr:YqaA family protein [Zavarzinia compransoris]PWR22266.1 cytochrome B [Zavarzinia compransoris]TDP46973.1 membrane protein YqaA with SNARE-associated domain [Zavarzinia compransoris]
MASHSEASPVPTPKKKSLLDKAVALASGPHGLWLLAVVAFAEASFFPIPPDPILAAVVLARRDRVWLAAAVCTVASVLGGLGGYAIGYGLYEVAGKAVIEFYHLEEAFHTFQARFAEWGGWIIIAKGFTPIPFKLVTIASGVAELDLGVFTASSILTRGARFLLVAWLFYAFGPQAKAVIARHKGKVLIGGTVIVIAGFAAFALL